MTSRRQRITRVFLWISVLAWGILVGGKLFDLRVLAVPPVMLPVTLVFTVLWFWPANAALWAVARHAPNAMTDHGEIARLVAWWVRFDWVRVAVGMVGLVCSTRAISVPFPAPRASRAA